MCYKVNHYTHETMLCKSLQTHRKKGGRSLRRAHCKGNLVPSRKPVTHKLSGTKSSPLGSQTVPEPLSEQNSTQSHRQHTVVAYINKVGGM